MPSAPALSEAAQAWAATKDTTSQAVLEDFIRQFGNTVYGSLAKARLEELKSTAQSRPAQSLEALVPETVPYVHDSDRAVIRNVYLSAPDHKALAISITQIGFVSGQATDEAAKTAALASCQKTTDAGGPIAAGQRCELYALGNTVVYAGGHPPLPPKPWWVRNPAIERPFAVKDVPLVSEAARAAIAKCYPDAGLYSKALAISPRGNGCYRNQQSIDEAARRALEACGSNGLPWMIVAVDDKFVVPIPTTVKAIGIFRPGTDTTLAADARDDVARRLAKAPGGWNAVAVGANGRPGIAVSAGGEQAALDTALTDCRKQDQDCHVISIGPFLVEPKGSSQPSAGSGQTGSADPFMRNVVTECDRLAGYPWDPHGAVGVSGVLFGKIDTVPAQTACNEAMRQYPDVVRFVYQAGRVANQQRDWMLARQYWEKAVALGSEGGMAGLGALYQYGLGVPQDYNEARRLYEKSAAAGVPGGMNSLGFLYETGAGVAKDYNEARRWYEKAAAVGEPNAMRNLGNLYQNGNGVPQDKLAARQWYEKAAAAGDDKSKDILKTLDAAAAPVQPQAGPRPSASADPLMRDVVTDCDRLAAYPFDPQRATGVSGVVFGKIDIVPALTACNEAMLQYPSVARFVLQAGRVAFQQKDYVLARQYLEKAVAMGSGSSLGGLGALYQFGFGVAQDYSEARRWYEKGVAAGEPGAMYRLGFLYETGGGVAKDYGEARRLYEKAAVAGEPNAMRNLGNLYQNGNGIPQDKLTARKWYEKAAAAGDDKSTDILKTLDAASAQAQPR